MALNWDAVRHLRLPAREYAVVGSGVLEAHGIREAVDTEIVCTDEQYRRLAGLPGTVVKRWDNGNTCIVVQTPAGAVEVNCEDSYRGGTFPGLDTILGSATVIDGVSFINLHTMRRWKAAAARPKDLADVAAIDAYLAGGRCP
jgi:hypothetical protein